MGKRYWIERLREPEQTNGKQGLHALDAITGCP